MMCMNPQRLLPIILAALLVTLVPGCETFPKSGHQALVGTWQNSIGTVWTLKADGTFDADLDKDGKWDASGRYTVEGNTVTTWRTGGVRPKGCDGKGIYKFTRTEKGLRFTLVSDKCKLRKQNVLLAWERK